MINTPSLHDKGFYEFKLPWVSPPSVVFECIAVRSFEDIYKLGIDVYTKYYTPVGLTDGININGLVFDFKEESKQSPNIITLKGSDGSTLYIPDTFITKTPDKTLVPYSEVVLGVSLGMLPDSLPVETVQNDIAALVAARMNINAVVHVCKVSAINNPTEDEHKLMESARLGKTSAPRPNTQMLLDSVQSQLKDEQKKTQTLLKIILDNGLSEKLK